MLNKIRKTRITVSIPTINRTKFVTRFTTSYIKNCPMKTDFVFVNSNKDKFCVTDETAELIENSGNTFVDHYIPPSTVGEGRMVGFEIAKDIGNEYVFSGDDDSRVGKMAIEKQLAPMFNDKRFWKVGNVGGYKCFMRDFQPNEVRFYAIIGVLWCTKLSVIEQIGNIHPIFSTREDTDFDARIWEAGGWMAIVDANVSHSRFQKVEYGERTIPNNNTEEYLNFCQLIADTYPKVFRHHSGKMYKQFEFPKYKMTFDDDLFLNMEKIVRL